MTTSPAPDSATPVSEVPGAAVLPIVSEPLSSAVSETPAVASSKGLLETLKGEGMVILGLTVLSYFAAYWFKVGEYLAHDISPTLIRIELVDSLSAGGYLGMALALVLLCYQAILGAREIASDGGRIVKVVLISVSILAAIYGLGWALLGMKAEETTSLLMTAGIYGGYVIIAGVIIFTAMYLHVGRKEGFRVVTDRVLTRSRSREIYREMWDDVLRAKVTITLLALVVMAFFVYMYGFSSARRDTSFSNLQGTDYVVIDTFDDRLLCKSLNEKRDGLLPGFTLVPLKEGEAVSFVNVKLNKKAEGTTEATAPASLETSKAAAAAPAAVEAPSSEPAASASSSAPAPSTAAPTR